MQWITDEVEQPSGEVERLVSFHDSNTIHFYRIDQGRKLVYRSEVDDSKKFLSHQMGVMAVQIIQDEQSQSRYIQAPPVDYAIASNHIAVLV